MQQSKTLTLEFHDDLMDQATIVIGRNMWQFDTSAAAHAWLAREGYQTTSARRDGNTVTYTIRKGRR